MTFSSSLGTSFGVDVGTSTDEQTTTTEVALTAIVGTQSPDDSTTLSTDLYADATAFGTDTLALTGVSGEAVDSGAVATLDADLFAIAVSEADDETAFAEAYTSGDISEGAEFFVITSVQSGTSEQGPDGSMSVSVSETSVTAVDVDPSDIGGIYGEDTDDILFDDNPVVEPDSSEESPVDQNQDDSTTSSSDDESLDLIDGNTAIALADFTAVSTDTYVEIDAYALAIEDVGSISSTLVIAAVSV